MWNQRRRTGKQFEHLFLGISLQNSLSEELSSLSENSFVYQYFSEWEKDGSLRMWMSFGFGESYVCFRPYNVRMVLEIQKMLRWASSGIPWRCLWLSNNSHSAAQYFSCRASTYNIYSVFNNVVLMCLFAKKKSLREPWEPRLLQVTHRELGNE